MSRKHAFTLVELLVVIGIIALLISLLLPSLAKARESANRAVCASNMRQVVQAFYMYAGEYRGTLPAAYFFAGTGLELNWDAALHRYLGWRESPATANLQVLKCPSDELAKGVTWWPYGERKSYLMVRAQGVEPGVGYAMRGTGQCFGLAPGSWAPANVPPKWIRINSVRESASTLLLVESSNGQNLQSKMSNSTASIGIVADHPYSHENGLNYRLHKGYYNYLFVDGHVSLLKPKETVRTGFALPSSQYQYNPGGMWSRTAGDN